MPRKDQPEPVRQGNARYSQQVADEICARISNGETMKSILEGDGMPCWNTVARWLRQRDDFREAYEVSRSAQADYVADQIHSLAQKCIDDPGNASGYKHAADMLKWQAMVRSPRKYSDRMIQENINRNEPNDPTKVLSEIAKLKKELGMEVGE